MLLVRMLGIAAKTRGHEEGSMWLKKNIIGSSGSVAELITVTGQRKTAWKHRGEGSSKQTRSFCRRGYINSGAYGIAVDVFL